MKPTYDTTVARIAGDIASGVRLTITRQPSDAGRSDLDLAAEMSVKLARAIVAEVKRTEPVEETPS